MMPFNLEFRNSHISINSFPSIEIPNFTIVTGKNGSGKSHLLQALQTGNIYASCAPNHQIEVKLFDWSNMVPQDTGMFSSEAIRNERQGFYQQIINIRNNQHFVEPIRVAARNLGLGNEYLTNIGNLARLTVEDIRTIHQAPGQAESVLEQLTNAIKIAEVNVLNQHDEGTKSRIRSVTSVTGKNIFAVTDKEIFTNSIPNWGQNDLFQQSFARLFVAYRDTFLENQLAYLQKQKGEDVDFMTDEQFHEKYGPTPWNFVNDSLISAGLDFSINQPHMYGYTPYEPRLTKKSTGAQIIFSNLSSGEKILMSFAFCVYYAQDRRQLSVYPKLLLLDEIDAPLHPSMSRGMIETIRNTLVRDFGISVILTTHSPSTVAMADEDTIYVMRGDGTGLHKTSKAAALNVLTEGVPTLAVNYGGRKQVFVESPADAQTYSDLFRVVKSRIGSECSLEFIATGVRSQQGEETNTGCDVVKRLVSELSARGNSTIFGLLDWDQKHEPSDRIYVLAHKVKDGLENVLLDPLLLAALICHEFPAYRSIIGVSDDLSYLEFLKLEQARLQDVVSRLCRHIFKSEASCIVSSRYIGGLTLEVDQRCHILDDHEFEKLIYESFPQVLSIAKQKKPGLLMQRVIGTVLMDNKDFTPVEVVELFSLILGQPSHLEAHAGPSSDAAVVT